MSTYEILVFENHDLYDSDIADPEDVVKKFIAMCRTYVPPEYVDEGYAELRSTNKTITYHDRNGDDKPKLIMLVGPITTELFDEMKEESKKLYIKKCEDCGVRVPRNWCLCKECANK